MVDKRLLRAVEGKHHDRKPPYSRKREEHRDEEDDMTISLKPGRLAAATDRMIGPGAF
jgi:hypothetical protein